MPSPVATSRAKKWMQVRLSSGTTVMTCWVDRTDIKYGDEITLKTMPNRRWFVEKCYRSKMRATAPYQPWKVGGLGN